EFEKAPFGILGLQTLVPLTLKLVEDNVISLNKMVELTSYKPTSCIMVVKAKA
ncbi:MAG TPA: dihydroorotase, partial [Rhizobiales bacterium]|nr:dihydroorotase [Hyphomicrobiales bacterium]